MHRYFIPLVSVIMVKENINGENMGVHNFIGGVIVVLILGQITSFPLFATIHSMFALQYLRASLTVPLYFDR